jgi:large subunit ribosomal protein L9
MKVLLRKNVRKLGEIGDVVDVKPGYARNYLVPQGLAIQPTDANLQQVEREKEAYLAELAKHREQLAVRAKAMDGKEITISARANEEGHLYGSIGPAQIAAALEESGVAVGADEIILDGPIRQLDKYDVKVELDEQISATVHVWVVPIREPGAEDLPAPPMQQEDTSTPEQPTADETSAEQQPADEETSTTEQA